MYIARQRGQVRIIPPRVRRPLQRPAQMGFLPFILPAIGLGTQIFGKLFTGGKGHQCSKTATDPESFLACWPYKPIPDNYVPYDAGGGKGW
ncbi:MAG TPA: hypothetical protein VFA71_03780, partial [Terriglobales bacterium]|nr:hypothetical protein [Terriglobales bacterium]